MLEFEYITRCTIERGNKTEILIDKIIKHHSHLDDETLNQMLESFNHDMNISYLGEYDDVDILSELLAYNMKRHHNTLHVIYNNDVTFHVFSSEERYTFEMV